jgi:hypothetical protein
MVNRMKNCTALATRLTRRILLAACVPTFVVAFTFALPQLARADGVTPPVVPAAIQVPAGNVAFLEGHAVGTQNYICLPSGAGVAWILFGPQATLFNDKDGQIITHFLSSNPFEGGTSRPTWQHSKDTSTVWGRALASSSDTAFVAPGAIPWLLVQVVGAQTGPTDGDRMAATTFIHRVNTGGGKAPSTGCALSTDVGKAMLVPYTADYFFYKQAD